MKTYQKQLLVAAVAVAGFAQVSPAPPSFPGFSGLYLYDEASGIFAVVPTVGGIANFVGAVGNYSVNISATGLTLSGGSFPSMDLNIALALAGPGATKLDIFYSDGAFGPTSGSYLVDTTGPFVGNVVSSAYLGNTFFSQTTLLASSLDVFPYTVNGGGTINANSYYLTIADVITGSEVSVDTAIVVSSVPEPSLFAYALLLLPIGLGAKRFLGKRQTA